MDKLRRRELKAEGKRLVAENSERIRQKLFERNPFPVGNENWVRNLQAEYKINRQYRKNSTEVLLETQVLANAEIKDLGFDFEGCFVPHAGWYVLCKECRSLVPSFCSQTLGCSCGAVVVMPETKQVKLPPSQDYAVVELIGRGPIRASAPKRPWWQLW